MIGAGMSVATYFVYSRGAFSSAKKGSNCNMFTETPQPFHAQPTTDFEEVSVVFDAVRTSTRFVVLPRPLLTARRCAHRDRGIRPGTRCGLRR